MVTVNLGISGLVQLSCQAEHLKARNQGMFIFVAPGLSLSMHLGVQQIIDAKVKEAVGKRKNIRI